MQIKPFNLSIDKVFIICILKVENGTIVPLCRKQIDL